MQVILRNFMRVLFYPNIASFLNIIFSPFIKKLINKINFEALDVKMDRAKELFYLLEDEDEHGFPGEVPVRNLQVELEAGGLRREHADLVSVEIKIHFDSQMLLSFEIDALM